MLSALLWLSSSSPGEVLARLLIWACWASFGLVWVIGWLYNLRHAPPVAARRGDLDATLIAIVLIAVGQLVVPPSVWAALAVEALPLRILGGVVLVLATAFTVWARLVLGTLWTSRPVIKQQHQLRTTGPYAFTRHPIYSGLLGMLIGTALLNGLGIWLSYVLVGLVVVKAKIAAEERLLEATFGEEYRAYRRRVGQLVPRVG
jgi:protein-S-isoprenylcysteine O-methyltransferase Ste14